MSTALKIMSYGAKCFAIVAALGSIPGVSTQTAAIIFFAASVAKDTVNRIGDFLDDGVENNSFGK